jgi:hypothetical protein
MNHDVVFSLAGMMAMGGWAALILSPLIPVWSDRIAGIVVPGILSAGYVVILLAFPAPSGGFGSFAEVRELFSHADALMAGWIHFLAFDLVIGAWICRLGRRHGFPFWSVMPCLPVTFLFGPAGFLLFQIIRAAHSMIAARAP